MRLKLSPRARYSLYCVGGIAAAVGLIGLGALLAPKPATAETAVEAAPPEEKAVQEEVVHVPTSAAGARSSGSGGQSWMTGDPAQLGADFKRSVARQFGNGTLGQAHMAMSGLGFQCALQPGGKMSCEKTIQADNCTLTWSVRLQSSGDNVRGAGGEGFSRDCS